MAGVLAQAKSSMDELDSTAEKTETSFRNAALDARTALLVVSALDSYLDGRLKTGRKALLARGYTCINAAVDGTTAYVNGDEKMRADAQALAASAPDPYATMPGRRPS